MSETRAEILTGAVVLAAAIGFALYAGMGSGLSAPSDSYPLKASFRSLEGISVGSDVRMGGVKVGSVRAIDLNPQTFRADLTVGVRDDLELPDDSAILVSSEGLLGGNFIELVPGGSPINLAPGEEILDTQSAVSLTSLLMAFVGGKGDSGDTGGDTGSDDAGADTGADAAATPDAAPEASQGASQ